MLPMFIFSANIAGEVFLKDTLSGDVKVCRGDNVWLVPQKTYDENRISLFYITYNIDVQIMRGHLLNNRKKQAEKYINIVHNDQEYITNTFRKYKTSGAKTIKCNLNGKFNFKNITSGKYTILSPIHYKIGTINTSSLANLEIIVKDKDMTVIVTNE